MATVAVNLDNAVLEGISKRAATMNLKPGDYVKRLVDAAYAARVGADRGMPSTDLELDAAVRVTFQLAGDFKPAAISRATGFPAQLVERILEGLRIASRGYSAPSGAGPSGGARDDARPPVGGSAPPEIAARGFAEGPARAEAEAPQLGGAGGRDDAGAAHTNSCRPGGGRLDGQAHCQGVDRRRPRKAQRNVGRRRHDDAHREGARPPGTGRAPVCGGSSRPVPEAAR